jgi:hypothetical protein
MRRTHSRAESRRVVEKDVAVQADPAGRVTA